MHSASLTCRRPTSSVCDLAVEVGIDRMPSAELGGDDLWISVDVYDANGERVGFGFPRATAYGRWATTFSLWDAVPGATYTVRATNDLAYAAETTVTLAR
jgi:hypothetical protein